MGVTEYFEPTKQGRREPQRANSLQPMTSARIRVGFLGPLGTFTEQAIKTQPDLAAAEHVLYRTMPDVLDAVEAGDVDLGFVAIENSIEGMVNLTQDELAFAHDLLIQREVVLNIEHCLMAKAGEGMHEWRLLLDPVGVASSLRSAMPRLGAWRLASSSMTAGDGLGISPWAALTVPWPTVIGLHTMRSILRTSRAAQVPTMSMIASIDPTS